MAGGTYSTQNKVRPGVYINLVSERKTAATVGERGIVALPLALSWGASQQATPIEAGSNMLELLGYDVSAPQLLLVRETLKRAKTVIVYRLNEGVKASVAIGDLTVTAKFGGVRGNDVRVVVAENDDDENLFDVATYVGDAKVDSQSVAAINGLNANAFVVFSGTGALTASAGAPLTGGTDGAVTNQHHTDALAAIELLDFHTVALVSDDASLKSMYTAFIRRMRENEGLKVQAVLANYPAADYEGVISVKNGVKLADGSVLNAQQATAWVAAATAGATMSRSLTYSAYEEAVDADVRLTHTQTEAALLAGELVFTASGSRVLVEQDINTLTSYSPEKGRAFAKNRVIRVLDGIAGDLKRLFETMYIGKIDNNPDGRSLFYGACASYFNSLQAMNAIQSFNAQTDLSVAAGAETDSIAIDAYVQPVDSVEKVYMKVTVK